MIAATGNAPGRPTRGLRRRAWAGVAAGALVMSLAACQPRPDEYTFRNETEHGLSLWGTSIPAGETVTITRDRMGCFDGVVLEAHDDDVVAVVDRRVCDGDTVDVGPGQLTKDEAHASITNQTDGALKIDLPLRGYEQVEPGETVEFALFREEGGCGEVAMEVEAGEEGLYAQPPDEWCDGDTWVIEPVDLWVAEGEPLHPGVVTVTNEGAEGVTVKASDVDPQSRNGQPESVFAGTPELLEPPGLQAGRCIRTAIEVQRKRSTSAVEGPWRRSDVVEVCDGDALRLTSDGGLVLLRPDGTEVPTGALVATTATVLVTNGTDARIDAGIGLGDTLMMMEPADVIDVPLSVMPGECEEVYVQAEVLWTRPMTEPFELCDGDVVTVSADGITVSGVGGGQQP